MQAKLDSFQSYDEVHSNALCWTSAGQTGVHGQCWVTSRVAVISLNSSVSFYFVKFSQKTAASLMFRAAAVKVN